MLFYNIPAEKLAQFAIPFASEKEDNAVLTYGSIDYDRVWCRIRKGDLLKIVPVRLEDGTVKAVADFPWLYE